MKPVENEKDTLERYKNAQANIIEFLNYGNMPTTGDLGASFKLAIQLLQNEIEHIEFIRTM